MVTVELEKDEGIPPFVFIRDPQVGDELIVDVKDLPELIKALTAANREALNITYAQIKSVRLATGVHMRDAERYLIKANGDFAKAIEMIHKQGQA